MQEHDALFALALKLTPRIGTITAKKIIEEFGSAKNAWQTKKNEIAAFLQLPKILATAIGEENILDQAKKEVDFLIKNDYKYLYYLNEDYPALLKEADDCPTILFTKGNFEQAFKNTFLSIVGTRNCTQYGKDFLVQLIGELKNQSITYVSGLAFGIDKIVHDEALKHNLPTIAIVGHGLQTIYPSEHKLIADKMILNGGLLTEYTSKEAMHPTNFISRNRIIAGLSKATLIIESDFKGGSLSTARFANDYNREVLALPGKVTDKYSTGCNNLIKNNKAMLLSNVEDVLSALDIITQKKPTIKKELFVDLKEPHKSVFELIGKEQKIHLDQISSTLSVPTYKLVSILLDLELKDLVISLSGGYYQQK
ncbi:MAG: DNA-processing protein DprA [Solirubrobacteraceae bacterium]